ncbi:uncharacterized protein LOC144907616 [Branchiostoma floridae x Branchiostoma belcheri]
MSKRKSTTSATTTESHVSMTTEAFWFNQVSKMYTNPSTDSTPELKRFVLQELETTSMAAKTDYHLQNTVSTTHMTLPGIGYDRGADHTIKPTLSIVQRVK